MITLCVRDGEFIAGNGLDGRVELVDKTGDEAAGEGPQHLAVDGPRWRTGEMGRLEVTHLLGGLPGTSFYHASHGQVDDDVVWVGRWDEDTVECLDAATYLSNRGVRSRLSRLRFEGGGYIVPIAVVAAVSVSPSDLIDTKLTKGTSRMASASPCQGITPK